LIQEAFDLFHFLLLLLRHAFSDCPLLRGLHDRESLLKVGDAIAQALGFDVMKAEGASPHILRKGQVGGWRDHFSDDDDRRLTAAIAERLPSTARSLVGLDTWRAEAEPPRRAVSSDAVSEATAAGFKD